MILPRVSRAVRGRPAFSLRELAEWLVFAALYVAAAKIGFRAAFVAEQVSPVWPPAGLALWALLRFGSRWWPAVWLAALVSNLTTHVPLVPAVVIATGNTLEAVVGSGLLRHFADVDQSLDRLRQVVMLMIMAAILSTAISATIGVTTLCAWGLQPWVRFGSLWWTWWLGDATGDLLVAPMLLTAPLWTRAKRDMSGAPAEMIAVEALAVSLSIAVFAGPATLMAHHPLEYILFPVVMWAGWRFAHPGAAVVSLTISSIAVWGTLHGTGPFSPGSDSPQETIVLLQIYAAVIASSGLVFGAAIADRNRSERLRETDHILTGLLSQESNLRSAAPGILKAVGHTLGWDVGLLWQLDNAQRTLQYVDSWQRDDRTEEFVAASRTRQFEPGIGLPGRVWATARPAWIYDVVADANFPRSPIAQRLGLHGALGFPILVGPNVYGVMEFFTREPRPLDAPVFALMAAAGSQIGQFIERRRAEQQAAESNALTAAIIDAALDCIISIDGNGHVIEFNPAAVRTFGFSREQVLGRELAEILVPDRLRDRHREALRRCVETGQSQILGRRLEMPAERADGTEFTVELAVTRVVGGARPVFTAHLRDITDRKRIEQERAELLERERAARLEAEHANRSKDQFLATVSHELRTPLTAILGWTSILRSGQLEAARVGAIHDRIFRNAQAQTQIVNDLLDVSRIVTGRLQLLWQEVDVCDVARLSLETIRPTAVAKGVGLESDIPRGRSLVSGDPARLQQVMWNLLSNAIKFTPTGGTVTLRVHASASRVAIEVRDTGIGIRAAFQPHLFERFWQADSTSTRAHGGLGLGLALVRHLVELHGGEVDAYSDGEGLGSTFLVRLPALAEPTIHGAAPSSRDQPDQQVFPDLESLKILVVDDDPGARELFAAILQGYGAHVICAESAAEAFRRYRSDRVDLMLVDIGMPDEDGFSLLRHIRAYEAARGLSTIPAIAVTAYAGPADRDNAIRAGFAAHVPKPVLPDAILSVVQEAARR